MVPTFQVQTRNLIDNPQLSGAIALITEDAIDHYRRNHNSKEPTILMDRELLSPPALGRSESMPSSYSSWARCYIAGIALESCEPDPEIRRGPDWGLVSDGELGAAATSI